jgi:hypothetical protein
VIALAAILVVLAVVTLAGVYRHRRQRRVTVPPGWPRVDTIRALDETGDDVDAHVFP